MPVRFTIVSNQSLVLWALILAWNWRQVNFNDQDKKTHEVLYDRVTTLTKPTSSAMSAAGGSGPSATSSASSGAASTTSGPGSHPAFAHLFHLILTQLGLENYTSGKDNTHRFMLIGSNANCVQVEIARQLRMKRPGAGELFRAQRSVAAFRKEQPADGHSDYVLGSRSGLSNATVHSIMMADFMPSSVLCYSFEHPQQFLLV